jgi:TFIIF-interacting CTD phosphatase-like protein
MAAIFIVAGLAIADKVEKKREQKRQKKAKDEARYRQLQIETNQRLARTQSGNIIDNSAFVEDSEALDSDDPESPRSAVTEAKPPAYEDAVQVGERREQQWKANMQRRRSSVYSQGSSRSNGAAQNFMKMG